MLCVMNAMKAYFVLPGRSCGAGVYLMVVVFLCRTWSALKGLITVFLTVIFTVFICDISAMCFVLFISLSLIGP